MCVTDRHDMTAVKVALNPNTTNQIYDIKQFSPVHKIKHQIQQI